MKILKIDSKRQKRKIILLAALAIKEGKIIIYPTDTVYGLGCALNFKKSVEKIFEIKKRPKKKPLSVAFSDLKMAKKYIDLTKSQEDFIKKSLERPYTFIVKKKKEKISDLITAKKDTLGIRIPNQRILREIIKEAAMPIITTSANISGKRPPATFKEIDPLIAQKADLAIDGGRCPVGKPSIIIDLEKGEILRR
jgi:L-threonylcarbamoyladenylate synthase